MPSADALAADAVAEPEPASAQESAPAETDAHALLADAFGAGPVAKSGLPPAEQVSTAAQDIAPVPLAEALAAAPVAEPEAEPGSVPAQGVAPVPLAEAFAADSAVEPDAAEAAGQAFTAQTPADRDAGDELLARVVPDAEPGAFAVPDPGPAAADPLPDAAPQALVPEENPSLPGQSATPGAPDAERLPPADQVFTADGAPAEPHRRAPAEENWIPRQGSHPDTAAAEAVTDKGLPKRTPRVVAAGRTHPGSGTAPGAGPARPAPRRVDAEELRRRLGGFYQGTRDGRRVVAAELAQDTDQGDTAQEART